MAQLPIGSSALLALAGLIRQRLHSTVQTTIRVGLVAGGRRDRGVQRQPGPVAGPDAVVVAAAGQFAPNAYARARLLRQLHACGLLSEQETVRAEQLFDIAR